jgi:hypothetical protein
MIVIQNALPLIRMQTNYIDNYKKQKLKPLFDNDVMVLME